MTTTQPDPIVTILFLGIIGLIGLMIVFRSYIASGARAAAGVAGANFWQDNWPLIAAIIIVPVGTLMLYSGGVGAVSWLFFLAAVAVAIFSIRKLLTDPPSSWVTIAMWAGILLFLSLPASVHFMGGALNWYNSFAPEPSAQSTEEAEELIPVLVGNELRVPPGGEVTYQVDHVFRLPTHACYDLQVMPPGVFGLEPGRGAYWIGTPPVIGVLETITVRSVEPRSNPRGCS